MGHYSTVGRNRWASAAALIAAAAALSACGSQGAAEVDSVALHFARSVANSADAAACRDLAPSTRSELEQSEGEPCSQALASQKLPSPGSLRGTQVFNTTSQASFAHDTFFLGKFHGGWKIIAAGCTPKPDQPYDCILQGG